MNKSTIKIKKKIITIMLMLGTMFLVSGNSKAALQANPTTHKSPKTSNPATWIVQIRQMEGASQTMGLSETINTSTLEATSESNNIDVHMQKGSEYGATAILSASGYGNPKTLQESNTDVLKRTTTGNATGVYFTGNRWEFCSETSFPDSGSYPYATKYTYSVTGNGGVLKTSPIGAIYMKELSKTIVSTHSTYSKCIGWHSNFSSWINASTNRAGLYCGGSGLFSYVMGSDSGLPSGVTNQPWDYTDSNYCKR